jgi:hypothetical protein
VPDMFQRLRLVFAKEVSSHHLLDDDVVGPGVNVSDVVLSEHSTACSPDAIPCPSFGCVVMVWLLRRGGIAGDPCRSLPFGEQQDEGEWPDILTP